MNSKFDVNYAFGRVKRSLLHIAAKYVDSKLAQNQMFKYNTSDSHFASALLSKFTK